jgi:hypothetical protein
LAQSALLYVQLLLAGYVVAADLPLKKSIWGVEKIRSVGRWDTFLERSR